MFTSKIDKSNTDGNGKASEAGTKLDVPEAPPEGSNGDERRATSLDRLTVRGFFRLDEDGELQIGGEVEGDIECHALTILESGSMQGNVLAERILIQGAYDGNVETTRLTVASTAKLISDDVLVHDQVVIEPEAHFEGVLRRPRQGAAEDARKPSDKAADIGDAGVTKAAAARKSQGPSKRGQPGADSR